jgi:hypothetical protein
MLKALFKFKIVIKLNIDRRSIICGGQHACYLFIAAIIFLA